MDIAYFVLLFRHDETDKNDKLTFMRSVKVRISSEHRKLSTLCSVVRLYIWD